MRISSETLFLESRLGYKDAVRYLCESGFDAIDYSLINKDIPIYGSGRDKIIDELKDIASFRGWDFESIWDMGADHPILRGFSEGGGIVVPPVEEETTPVTQTVDTIEFVRYLVVLVLFVVVVYIFYV